MGLQFVPDMGATRQDIISVVLSDQLRNLGVTWITCLCSQLSRMDENVGFDSKLPRECEP